MKEGRSYRVAFFTGFKNTCAGNHKHHTISYFIKGTCRPKTRGGTGLSVVLLGGVVALFPVLYIHPPPVGYYCQSLVQACSLYPLLFFCHLLNLSNELCYPMFTIAMQMTDTHYHIAIIGGGLAGLALAIQAADASYQVVLFEKEAYPFHKVCGEYISMESFGFIEGLGVPLSSMQLPIIHQLQVSDMGGKMYSFPLPLGGFGISRYLLDNELYQLALKKGVHFFTETKVTGIDATGKCFLLNTSAGNFTADVVTGSFGKRSNIDVKWKRPFTQQKPNKLNNYVGVKYHIQHQHPIDTIALHNFKGGYCGMSAIEGGKSCLCYLTPAANLTASQHSIAEMEKGILQQNPQLQAIFNQATFLYKEPLTISQVSFAKKKQVENNMLMLGDAAGLITPLCGNGMSMALHSSKLAIEAINLFLRKKISRHHMELQYQQQWKKQFSRRLWMGRQVQRLFGGRRSTSLFLKAMHSLPFLSRMVISSTHGKPF